MVHAMLSRRACASHRDVGRAWVNILDAVPIILVGRFGDHLAYQGQTAPLRFASLQRLYDFSRTIGYRKPRAIVDEPRGASVRSAPSCGPVRRSCPCRAGRYPAPNVLDDHGPPRWCRSTSTRPRFVTEAIEDGVASCHTTATAQRKGSYDPVAGRYVHAIVAPLVNENIAIGAIVALDRDEEFDEFDETISASSRPSWRTPAQTSSGPVSSRSCDSRSRASRIRPPTTCSPDCPTACCSSAGHDRARPATRVSQSSSSTSTGSRTSTTRWATRSATGSSARFRTSQSRGRRGGQRGETWRR